MPTFSTEVSHSLGQQAATERLMSLMEQMKAKYEDQVEDLEGSWSGNQLSYSFSTFGMDIKGTITVLEAAARVEGHLPFAVMAFRGAIEQQLRSELEKALGTLT